MTHLAEEALRSRQMFQNVRGQDHVKRATYACWEAVLQIGKTYCFAELSCGLLLPGIDRYTCDPPSIAAKNSRIVPRATATVQDSTGGRGKQTKQTYVTRVLVDEPTIIVH